MSEVLYAEDGPDNVEVDLPSSWGKAMEEFSFVKLYHKAPTQRGSEFIRRYGISIGVPVKDVSGIMTGYYLRSIEHREHYAYLGGSPFYFGPKFLPVRSKVGVIVEGVLDNLSVSLWADQVVSVLASSMTSYQVIWARLLFERVLLISDNDGPGRRGSQIMKGQLEKNLVFPHTWLLSKGKDPGDMFGDVEFGESLKSIVRSLEES